jgi:hypothetical protein
MTGSGVTKPSLLTSAGLGSVDSSSVTETAGYGLSVKSQVLSVKEVLSERFSSSGLDFSK